jgi:hypothetical protein
MKSSSSPVLVFALPSWRAARPPARSEKRLAAARADRRGDRPLQALVVVGDPVDAGADFDELERTAWRRPKERERLRTLDAVDVKPSGESPGSRIAGMRSCARAASGLAEVVTMQAVSMSPPLGSHQVS